MFASICSLQVMIVHIYELEGSHVQVINLLRERADPDGLYEIGVHTRPAAVTTKDPKLWT